jgi:hypothetical protein
MQWIGLGELPDDLFELQGVAPAIAGNSFRRWSARRRQITMALCSHCRGTGYVEVASC